jgi:hypothetical protein
MSETQSAPQSAPENTTSEAPATEVDNQHQNPSNADGGGSLADVLETEPKATEPKEAEGDTPPHQNEPPKLAEWTSQLSKDILSDAGHAEQLADFKTVSDLARAYFDAAGKKAIPAKDAPPEDVETFFQELGKPKSKDDYSFGKDKNAKEFCEEAFNLNLTEAQASALWKNSVAQVNDAMARVQANQAAELDATDKALRAEYGERYDEAMAFHHRALGIKRGKNGKPVLSPIAKTLLEAGVYGKPEIARAFIELGRATSEGFAPGGDSGDNQPDSVLKGRHLSYKSQEEYLQGK